MRKTLISSLVLVSALCCTGTAVAADSQTSVVDSVVVVAEAPPPAPSNPSAAVCDDHGKPLRAGVSPEQCKTQRQKWREHMASREYIERIQNGAKDQSF